LAHNAIRLSAILAIAVAALSALPFYFSMRDGSGIFWPQTTIAVLVPLVIGVLALMNRATYLLLFAWGWVLGAHLPRIVMVAAMSGFWPAPAIPPDMLKAQAQGQTIFVIDHRPQLAMVVLAFAGLALYFFGYYRGAKKAGA
jgi:hypothetical protein